MRFSEWFCAALVCTLSLGCASLAGAQTPPAEPTLSCEQQVQEQYRQLSTDNLVPQATALEWGPELLAIVTQLRVSSNQYQLKKNQAEFAEQNWLRILADQRMRSTAPAPPAAAAN